MLYGAPHQMRILAADLRAGDRLTADRARAHARAAAPTVGPLDHDPAIEHGATARAAGPAAATASAPARWWPRLAGRPAR